MSRQLTPCKLVELVAVFGLGHAGSARERNRRVDCALPDCAFFILQFALFNLQFAMSGTALPAS